MCIPVIGRQENGFHSGEMPIHYSHGSFILVVHRRTQTLDDCIRTMLPAKVHEEAFAHWLNADPAEPADRFLDHFQALGGLEPVLFGVVGRNRHDHLVKETAGSGNDLDMTIVDRVKGSGADGSTHTQQSIKGRRTPPFGWTRHGTVSPRCDCER